MLLDRDKDNSRRGTYCSYNFKKNNEYKQITTANTHAKQLRIKEVRSTRIQTHVLMRVKFPKSLFSHRQEVWSNISTSRWLSLRTRRPHNARACVIHHGAHFYPHIHHRRRARGEPAQLHGTPCVITQCPGPHRQPARANYGLALTRSSAESPSPPPPHHPHPHIPRDAGRSPGLRGEHDAAGQEKPTVSSSGSAAILLSSPVSEKCQFGSHRDSE